jgi:hypothetical protein
MDLEQWTGGKKGLKRSSKGFEFCASVFCGKPTCL